VRRWVHIRSWWEKLSGNEKFVADKCTVGGTAEMDIRVNECKC